MREVRVSEDIVPISEFKAHASDWLQQVAETDQPLVITQNGKAAGVLLSPAEFDRLTERARFLQAIDEGLADEAAGRVHSHEDVIASLKARASKRPRRR
jgi:prevent-host-death family protein